MEPSKYKFTVGILGPRRENGKRWFEVVSRHTLQSEASIAVRNSQRSLTNDIGIALDARYQAELRTGDLNSGYDGELTSNGT